MEANQDLVAALRRHVAALCAIAPRTAFHGDSLVRAQDYIRAVWEGAGLAVEAQGYDYYGRRVANLVARVGAGPGGDYVVGAHYDTVPGTPGADDNASAVAVLLELGRFLAARPAAFGLMLAAFTLEEPPTHATRHQGSRVFLRRARENGERIEGAIVLEMVGFTTARQEYPLVLRWAGYPAHGRFIGIVGSRKSRRFGKRLLEGFRRNPELPVESLFVPLRGWVLPATRLSDHASFWDAGIPAVMVTDTAFFRNPHYHTAADRPETLDYPFMAQVARSVALALEALTGAP